MSKRTEKLHEGKSAKKPKRLSKYKIEWEREFEVGKVQDNLHKFHCNTCNTNISCAHGGRNDIEKHFKSESHINTVKSTKGVFIFYYLSYMCILVRVYSSVPNKRAGTLINFCK